VGIAVSKETEHTHFLYTILSQNWTRGLPMGNRLYRYEMQTYGTVNCSLICHLFPGSYHNGGAITIGPNQNVYFTNGDMDNVDNKGRLPQSSKR
jgi:hypothetical protein